MRRSKLSEQNNHLVTNSYSAKTRTEPMSVLVRKLNSDNISVNISLFRNLFEFRYLLIRKIQNLDSGYSCNLPRYLRF